MMALSILLSSLALGTMITLSSFHWIVAWIGLEINTLAIIPLMTMTRTPRATEAATKYFLTQATASTLILFSSVINAWLTGEWSIFTNTNYSTVLLTIAISMKLGMAPFHFWLPEVLQGLPLSTGLILSTWQKLAPMALLLQTYQHMNLNLLLTLGVLSTLLGGWGGINQTQIRKILAFSSITHLGWMAIILKFAPQLTLMNFTLYILMTTTLFLTFRFLNTKSMYELQLTSPKSPALASASMLVILSIGGLPPFTGFLPKWFIAQELIKQDLAALTTIILLLTLLSLFFYLRMTYIMSLVISPFPSYSSPSWFQESKYLYASMIIISLLLTPMYPLTITLF